jgi:hypothetical protein
MRAPIRSTHSLFEQRIEPAEFNTTSWLSDFKNDLSDSQRTCRESKTILIKGLCGSNLTMLLRNLVVNKANQVKICLVALD